MELKTHPEFAKLLPEHEGESKMKTKVSFCLMVCGVLLVLWVVPVLGDFDDEMYAPRAYLGGSRGNTFYVGSGQVYSKIQDAVDAASYGDTVFVYNGTYEESIQLKPGIKLIGETPNRPILDGANIPEIKYGRVLIMLN